ncbi:hypothetical protein KIPB_012210, partial [Kipferlia bialata]
YNAVPNTATNDIVKGADGVIAVTGHADRNARLYDMRQSGGMARVFTGHRHHISSVSLSPSGPYMASTDALGHMRIWDLRSTSVLHTVDIGDAWVKAIKDTVGGETVVEQFRRDQYRSLCGAWTKGGLIHGGSDNLVRCLYVGASRKE